MPPEERVASSVGLSLLLIYLSSFLIFLLRLPAAVHGSILLVCAGMTFAVWRDLGRLLKDREVRRLLLGFGVLAIWASPCCRSSATTPATIGTATGWSTTSEVSFFWTDRMPASFFRAGTPFPHGLL